MRHSAFLTLCLLTFACSSDEPGGTTDDTGTPVADCSTREALTPDLFVDGGSLPAFTCWSVGENLSLDGGVFTIEEGVDVVFATGIDVYVRTGAQLAMAGLVEAPITLHTGDPVITWTGIALENSQGSNNQWSHVVIENAGDQQWNGASDSFAAVWVEGTTTLSLDHVTFRNSPEFGLQVRGDEPVVTADNLAFEGNGKTAWVSAQNAAGIGGTVSYADNADDRIYVGGGNGSDITVDTTWAAVGGGWHVLRQFNVAATWTLEPGNLVHFAEATRVTVLDAGTLIADGTAEAPIVMEAAVPGTAGYWNGIEVESTGSAGPLDVGAFFNHVSLLDGGHGQFNGNSDTVTTLFLNDNGKTRIQNTTISNGLGYGIWVNDEHQLLDFEANTIDAVDVPVIAATSNVADLLSGGSSFSGVDPRIHIGQGNTQGLESSAVWENPGVPLFFVDRLNVRAALTIAAGSVLEFDQSVAAHVEDNGSLTAEGTAADPIEFRGGNAISDGYWTGIRFDSRDNANRLTYTTIRHAGLDQWNGNSDTRASIFLGANALLNLDNSEITEGGGYAMWLSNGADFSCSSTPFHTVGYDDELDALFSGC